MEFTYLVGDGPEAADVVKSARDKVEAFYDAVRNEMGKFPEGTEACQKRFGISGLLRVIDNLFSEKECKVFGIRPENRFSIEGKIYQHYVPDLRTSTGKQFKTRLLNINKKKTSFSDAAIAETGTERMIVGNSPDGSDNALYSSAAGAKGNKLFIRIPGKASDRHEDPDEGGDVFPALPSWLREPQDDEFKFFLP